MKQVVLFEMGEDELEDVEVEIVGRHHEAALGEITIDGHLKKRQTGDAENLVGARLKASPFDRRPPTPPSIIVAAVVRDAALLTLPGVSKLRPSLSSSYKATRFTTTTLKSRPRRPGQWLRVIRADRR